MKNNQATGLGNASGPFAGATASTRMPPHDNAVLTVDCQIACESWTRFLTESSGAQETFLKGAMTLAWIEARPAVAAAREITVVFTDDRHVARLNNQFRGQDRPTNVLSFSAQPAPVHPPERDGSSAVDPLLHLGDIVLACETIWREAEEQGVTVRDHTCHLLVHGVLHLLGYDHETDAEATRMEALETTILAQLGIDDPYGGCAPE